MYFTEMGERSLGPMRHSIREKEGASAAAASALENSPRVSARWPAPPQARARSA
jgi:hypothetical protein